MSTVLDPPAAGIKPTALAPPDSLFEVVNGQRVELPEMSIYSSFVAMEFFVRLRAWLQSHRLGRATIESLYILDAVRDLRRRPDVAYVSFERWPADREIPEAGDWEVVPDLAVEVVSPSDIFKDVLHKVHEYLQYGVTEVWVISPEEQVLYCYRSPQDVRVVTSDQELSGDPLLPGFRLKLADLFHRTLAAPNP